MGRFNFHRNVVRRCMVLCAAYAMVFFVSHFLAFEARFDFDVKPEFAQAQKWGWLWELPLRLLFLWMFGQFSGLLSYFSIPDFRKVVMAVGGSSMVLLAGFYFPDLVPFGFKVEPRGVMLMDFLLATAGITAVRLSFRMIRERFTKTEGCDNAHSKRVAIIGAGDVGANLARELLSRRGMGRRPVMFFDDDPSKRRTRIHGVQVVGAPELLENVQPEWRLDEAIIAIPSATAKRRGEIIGILQKARLDFKTVPSLDQLTSGKVRVSQLRPVEIADLLGRDPVELEAENIREILQNKVVMVTGAGGSIGSELCRQIAEFNPVRLLLVEQSEVQMFPVEQELIAKGHRGVILPLIADIMDSERMRYLFERFKPQVIFHAAAHKHVPLMEEQPSEAIKNNTFGTARMIDLAVEFEVERFVLISTDKAINPTSVMGATKRLAEIYLQAVASANGSKTRLMAVRFGNVLGSSGSVIPIFKKQIEEGGPVKVTHPEVTRYFMTIPEAVGLVLQSGAQGRGGEIFVLNMGKPVKIVDLARQLIELSGLRPEEDIEIKFVGLRPGEKLFEEISHKAENMEETEHSHIMRFVCEAPKLDEVRAVFDEFGRGLHATSRNRLKQMIQEAVPEYSPYLD